eukprot:s1257_g9.t1
MTEHLQKTRSKTVKTRVQALVRTPAFEMACALVVIANAVIIGIRADLPVTADMFVYDIIELIMALAFLAELVLRVAATGRGYFTDKGGLFNTLDALLIFVMFADAINALANVHMLGIDDGGLMKLYRVVRLLRVIRMARLFHMVPELHFTLTLMTTSSTSFFWAAVLMLLIMYLVALYFTVSRQFAETEFPETADGVRPPELDALEVFWGSTGKSINSLFLAVFGLHALQQDWHNMLLVFGDGSWWYIINSIVLSLFVGFALVVLLNLVNGVLVEGAQTMIAERKQNELVRMAADIFVHSGHKAGSELTPEEFDALVHTKAMDNYLEAIGSSANNHAWCRLLPYGEGIDPNEAGDRLFRFLDRDDSGSVSVVEFVQGCLRLRGPAKALDLAEMHLWSKERNVETTHRIGHLRRSMDEVAGSLRQTGSCLQMAAGLHAQLRQQMQAASDLDKLVKEIFVRQEPFNMAFAGAMRNLNLGAAHIAPGDVNQRAAQAAAQPYADVLYGNGAAHVLNQTEERERVIRLCMAALPVHTPSCRKHCLLSFDHAPVVAAVRAAVDLLRPTLASKLGVHATMVELAALISRSGADAQPVHRDVGLTGEEESEVLTVQLILQDTDEAMGPLVVEPGTHRAPLEARPEQQMALPTPRGSLLLFNGRLRHCGGAHFGGLDRVTAYVTFMQSKEAGKAAARGSSWALGSDLWGRYTLSSLPAPCRDKSIAKWTFRRGELGCPLEQAAGVLGDCSLLQHLWGPEPAGMPLPPGVLNAAVRFGQYLGVPGRYFRGSGYGSSSLTSTLICALAAMDQNEKAFQKQDAVFIGSKRVTGKKTKKAARYWRSVGLGFATPKEAKEGNFVDKKNVSIRGAVLKGMVISTKMKRTIVIRRNYLHYIKKFNRFEKRHSNLAVHCSPAFEPKEGDIVTAGQCRPLAKTVRFNVLKVDKNQIFGSARKQFALF